MNNFVTLKTFTNEFEAEMAQVRLEDAGITAFIAKDDCGSMEPHLQLTRGVGLKVQEKDFTKAVELIGRIDFDYSSDIEGLDESDDQEWDNFKKQQKKSGAFGGRILGLTVASIFYALSFLPMKESDKIMKSVLIGSALFFSAIVLLSFYKGKD